MNFEQIHQEFKKMIRTPSIHRRLNMKAHAVMQLRHRLKKGDRIRIDFQIRLLQRSGVRMDHHRWTDKDMTDFVTFWNNTSEAARQFGASYVLEKFRSTRSAA